MVIKACPAGHIEDRDPDNNDWCRACQNAGHNRPMFTKEQMRASIARNQAEGYALYAEKLEKILAEIWSNQ